MPEGLNGNDDVSTCVYKSVCASSYAHAHVPMLVEGRGKGQARGGGDNMQCFVGRIKKCLHAHQAMHMHVCLRVCL
jgi:hypothetical protein